MLKVYGGENRYRAIVESLANIILNIILGKIFGIAGIIAGTLISLLIINFGYGSQILFEFYFGKDRIIEYFKSNIIYALVTFVISIVTGLICYSVGLDGINGIDNKINNMCHNTEYYVYINIL